MHFSDYDQNTDKKAGGLNLSIAESIQFILCMWDLPKKTKCRVVYV